MLLVFLRHFIKRSPFTIAPESFYRARNSFSLLGMTALKEIASKMGRSPGEMVQLIKSFPASMENSDACREKARPIYNLNEGEGAQDDP